MLLGIVLEAMTRPRGSSPRHVAWSHARSPALPVLHGSSRPHWMFVVLYHMQVLLSPFPKPLLIHNPIQVPNPMGFVFSCNGFFYSLMMLQSVLFKALKMFDKMAELNGTLMVKQCICTKVPGNNRIL
ncbi:hypothetical protein BDA96_10G154000 [Sorghum bicolor]|uniref:Uncharacterized protein n=1 Tax=Sorghum bicolor TaxID=4558 RepID=A0A921Q4N3_SORBI|nr:hypothetical protein BDA96_10G154000 [Sorghum bicolor]